MKLTKEDQTLIFRALCMASSHYQFEASKRFKSDSETAEMVKLMRMCDKYQELAGRFAHLLEEGS